jgi:ApaG protein
MHSRSSFVRSRYKRYYCHFNVGRGHVVATIASGAKTLFTTDGGRSSFAHIGAEGLTMSTPKPAYSAVTRQIEVKVRPTFLPERSSPENGYFFWAYTITLTNLGRETVQLKTRHWRITDAHGRLQEVRGAGVVGEEPVLKPGQNYEYTSGVPLPTSSGFMVGSYGMITETGETFDIEIPAFSLDLPQRGRTIN